jgi:hypothetical protein
MSVSRSAGAKRPDGRPDLNVRQGLQRSGVTLQISRAAATVLSREGDDRDVKTKQKLRQSQEDRAIHCVRLRGMGGRAGIHRSAARGRQCLTSPRTSH